MDQFFVIQFQTFTRNFLRFLVPRISISFMRFINARWASLRNKSLSDRPLRRICTFVLLYLRIDITCSARTIRIHYHRESCLCSRRSRSRKYVSSLSRMFTRPFTTYRILRIRSIITYESRRVDQSTLKRFAFPFLSSFLKITREINI